MKIVLWGVAFLLLVLGIVASMYLVESPSVRPGRITIAYAGDILGDLKPCG